MHSKALFTLLTGATAVVAQSNSIPGPAGAFVTSWIFPDGGVDVQTLGSGSSLSSYLVKCGPSTAAADCPLLDGVTVIAGSSTVEVAMVSGVATISEACKLYATTSAVCVGAEIASGSTVSLTTQTLGGGSASVPASMGASPTNTMASVTGVASSGMATGIPTFSTSGAVSGSQVTSAAAMATATSTATTTQTKSHNAAMPLVTGNAHWVVGGAALAAVMAMV